MRVPDGAAEQFVRDYKDAVAPLLEVCVVMRIRLTRDRRPYFSRAIALRV